MKSFLEKSKDFLYDGVDYIIMTAIIIIVVLIINWRLDGLFAQSNVEISPESSTPVAENESNNDEEIKVENKVKDSFEKENEYIDSQDTQEKKESGTMIEINIPAGSASSNIASILVDSGLIKEKDLFLKKLSELNLETKLKYGKYKVPKNSSLEEILSILTK